ncbi:glycosyltransferase family 32 protein [Purpureocillium lavendulum]|uniref:Glycosyltransferase family 32 protein n=1 Tax=Purpureocillium lavendulum TaxID=1247861 RepID=A0AB34FUY1_9HYPO|nr:glycosyltransferase family 32 protein [Purpureocillium lavendulum]
MAKSKPTILLVHGGWHTTEAYRQLLDIFESKGYETCAPELPSGAEDTPANPPEADIRCIANATRSLVEMGEEVVVVAHSYGGAIAPQALHGLGLRFLLEVGKSLEMSAPVEILPWVEYEGDFKIITPGYDAGPVFYPDLPRDEQQAWLAKFTKHPKACSFYSPKQSFYEEVDLAYVYCELDEAAPFVAQKAMVDAIRKPHIDFQEATLQSGHFPMLSMPDVLADTILGFM